MYIVNLCKKKKQITFSPQTILMNHVNTKNYEMNGKISSSSVKSKKELPGRLNWKQKRLREDQQHCLATPQRSHCKTLIIRCHEIKRHSLSPKPPTSSG
ncbi:unnamed protein product, partial [Brassica oleracea]